jgi:hypothetical protein
MNIHKQTPDKLSKAINECKSGLKKTLNQKALKSLTSKPKETIDSINKRTALKNGWNLSYSGNSNTHYKKKEYEIIIGEWCDYRISYKDKNRIKEGNWCVEDLTDFLSGVI